MTVGQSLAAFTLAAGLLTLTPGLDTALVLRTAAVEGPRRGALAASGVCLGTICWGLAVAFGLGAVLAASPLAFEILKWAGAAYLLWLGAGLLIRPRKRFDLTVARTERRRSGAGWLARGLTNNLLNPKAGVFYVSFLPQFLPAGVPAAPYLTLLGCLHALMGAGWFAVLIGSTRPFARLLQRSAVVQGLDRVTGGVFIGFGLRLAFERR